ncbi:MAG: hypothetical protein J5672_03515, partial [Verrucomicrobia bacterium]|nr:hypothetical protein [Verrucomicrobiota bacterium]
FIICWAMVMLVGITAMVLKRSYEWHIEMMLIFLVALFIWYITFKLKKLGLLMQWNLMWMLFYILLLESLILHYLFHYNTVSDELYYGALVFPHLSIVFFFVFQLIRKAFFNQKDTHITRNYTPVKKSIRLTFSIFSIVGVFYYAGWWIMLISNAIKEEIEGYYWIN